MSFFLYIYFKIAAVVIRGLATLVQGKLLLTPMLSATFHREITIAQSECPRPRLINFHGSGFIIPAHGSDDAFCRQIS